MVAAEQRFVGDRRCPVCSGSSSDASGKGVRCWGFAADDTEWSVCTRKPSPHSAGDSGGWSHLVDGDCPCGSRHGYASPPPAVNHGGPRPVGGRGQRTRTVYKLLDQQGTHIANHVRLDYEHGGKDLFYTLPNGDRSLGGLSQLALPLYGVQELPECPSLVVVGEGEKARDALKARGIVSVGTACGAGSTKPDGTVASVKCPDDDVLRPLLSCATVVLWPDNDEIGRAHMRAIGNALVQLGHADVRVVEWPEAPAKGDAADFRGSDADLSELLAEAQAYSDVAEVAAMVPAPAAAPAKRRLSLTPASSIPPRPVRWLWDTALTAIHSSDAEGRFPEGSLAIAVGRAGLGKSQFACWMSAHITRGTLPGTCYGTPRSVIYAASEDSWAMTIIPRLMASGADLDRVFRIDVTASDGGAAQLSLPDDTAALREVLLEGDVALVVLDPLLSILDSRVDDYRAKEVRAALEPLIAIADEARVTMLGLAHFTKASGSDPLMLISGSGAFGQLIRAGVGFAKDEESDGYVLSTIKNNLGREDLPSLSYTLEPAAVPTPDGEAWVSRFVFGGETPRTVRDILRESMGAPADRSAMEEAEAFLRETLAAGPLPAKDVRRQGDDAGLSWATIRRAQKKLGVETRPRVPNGPWYWSLAGASPAPTTRAPEVAQETPKLLTSEHEQVRPELSNFGTDAPVPPEFDDFRCIRCGAGVDAYSPAGEPLCAAHSGPSEDLGPRISLEVA